MNLQNLVDQIQKISLPETALRSMYDIVAHGSGEPRIIRLENGNFYQKDGNEYFKIEDIFSYIFESIPNAPGIMIKSAKKMMQSQKADADAAIKTFCGNGGTALIFLTPKSNEIGPKINAIIKVKEEVTKYEDMQLFEMFALMMKN